MLGGLLRLAVFRMLPRRILPLLLVYEVYRMFHRRAADRRLGRDTPPGTNTASTTGRSSGGRW